LGTIIFFQSLLIHFTSSNEVPDKTTSISAMLVSSTSGSGTRPAILHADYITLPNSKGGKGFSMRVQLKELKNVKNISMYQ
jgi:hypothetical protein